MWLCSLNRLGELRRARDLALREAYESGIVPGVTGYQLDVFLIEPSSDRYLGRLCDFTVCPKAKPECYAPGCGGVSFNKQIEDFRAHDDLLAPAAHAMLYRHGEGRLMSALDLPPTDIDRNEG